MTSSVSNISSALLHQSEFTQVINKLILKEVLHCNRNAIQQRFFISIMKSIKRSSFLTGIITSIII